MQKPFDSLHVLVVDDDETQLELMIIYLRQLGITKCSTAGNGEEALALLVEQNNEFDIVFTDKDMPRMNGVQFIEEMGLYPSLDNIKVVMTTDNLTDSRHKTEEETALRSFLEERNVLPLPKTGLNADVLSSAFNKMLGL